MDKNATHHKFPELRKRAEAFLTSGPGKVNLSEEEVQKLVHELSIYQLELELQNEDLLHTQEELLTSKQRYAELYDFAPVGFFNINESGFITEANHTGANMLGMTRKNLLGSPFSKFIVEEDQNIYFNYRSRLLATGEQQSYELRLCKENGAVFYALIEIIYKPDCHDFPGRIHLAATDVSLRKEVETAKILQMKNRYRAIVMDQTELICRFDPEGRITFANDAYCRYFGLSFKKLLGTNFLPNIHENDLPLVCSHFKTLTPLQPERTIEHRVFLPNGEMRWQQWCGRALFDPQGKLIEYQGVGRDITNLKNAEEKLHKESQLRQLFLDALPCIAMLLEAETRMIIAANKAAVEVGASPGQHCYSSWLHNDAPCPFCPAETVWTQQKEQNYQFWNNDIYWDAFWVPVDEKLYLHYLFDITDKQKDKEALEKAHTQLEERVRERTEELQRSHAQLLHSEKLSAVGNLSASIAHEFNNPLQSVMTIIKGIEQYAKLETKEQELVGLALQECHRMKNLIGDLRDFSRPTSGKLDQMDLHAALEALLLLCKKDFQTRNITLVKKFSKNIPHITAVADQLKQVFLNLLSNAADACEGGGVITVTTEAKGDKEVAVHIEDSGQGIPAANLEHIFEPFFTTKPEMKGTGLGLSVSYGIVKNHGGRIDVHSKAGENTVFTVHLPIERVLHEH